MTSSSLHWRIVAVLLVVSLLPLALVGVGSWVVFGNILEERSLTLQRSVVEAHAKSIDFHLAERLRALDLVSRSHRLGDLHQEGVLEQLLGTINESYSMSFVDLGVINEDGDHLAYVGPYALRDKNYAGEHWFKAVMSQGAYVSDVFMGFRRVPHCIIAVVREEGTSSWILRATINSDQLDRLVHPGRIGTTGDAFIVNTDGACQTPSHSGNVLERSSIISPARHSGVRQSRVSQNGSTMLRATRWLNDGRWMLVVQQDEAEVQAPIRHAMLGGVLIVLAAVALLVGTTILATRHLTGQIDRANAQREALSRSLLRSAKLASLGEMSTGLAHEINNPLAIISAEHTNIADMIGALDLNTQVDKELSESVDRCKRQVKRCGDITSKMLEFGRHTDAKLQLTEVVPRLDEVVSLMHRQALIRNIDLAVNVAREPPLPQILVDQSELEQVLLNLINNSMHAIEGGGRIELSACRDGNDMLLTVSDNGKGIAPEDLDKIFQPFFTTKAPGEGTGLGLSTCYGIVRSWGGSIEATSELGKGTAMTIRLPLPAGDDRRNKALRG